MNGRSSDVVLPKVLRHEVGVPDPAAKSQRPLGSILQIVFEDQIAALGDGKGLFQLIGNIAPVGHGDGAVVGGVVVDSVVVKGN